MKGTILYVNPDAGYGFRGAITGEDGVKYHFNSGNWYDKTLKLEDVFAGAEVEFDLKAPNAAGNVFPKLIRFAGTTVAPVMHIVKHSRGDFQALVFVHKELLYPALDALVGGFDPEEIPHVGKMYRKIAEHYNELSDADFLEKGTGDNAILLIPTGFTTTAGDEISLYCTKNTGNEKSAWYCKNLCVNGRVCGESVFSQINANWYDVRYMVIELAGEQAVEEDAQGVIQRIEKRCADFDAACVCLKDGQETDFDMADTVYLPTSYYEPNGKEIYLGCWWQNGGAKGAGWYVKFATYENAPLTVWGKKRWLEMWGGYMSKGCFQDLANQTLEEKWDFGGRSDFGILRNYLQYTFAHQWMQGKIAYSEDSQYAAFNTGLPDRDTYKYIYALFEKLPETAGKCHPLHCRQQYVFQEFVLTGRGGGGKTLTANIHPLPAPPQYFKDRSSTVWELDFNDSNQVTLPGYDDAHILIQRCERIPLDFYEVATRKSPTLAAILDSEDPVGEKCKNIKEFFKPILDKKMEQSAEATAAYRTLSNALKDVIWTAVQKLSWNWRAVVPCYNPSLAEPCFLLPVSFGGQNEPDRAMIATVERTGDTPRYIIHTVIPLNWAYLNARLVCRPESEWLGTDFTSMDDDDDSGMD